MSPTRLTVITAVAVSAMVGAAVVARPRLEHYMRWRRLDPAARAAIGPFASAPLAIPDPELADLEL